MDVGFSTFEKQRSASDPGFIQVNVWVLCGILTRFI